MILRENVVGYVDKGFIPIKVTTEAMLMNEISEGQCNMCQSYGKKKCDSQRQRGNHSKLSPLHFVVESEDQRQGQKFGIYKNVIERDF